MKSKIGQKCDTCPYWPAKIINTPPELGACPKNKNCVLFFGTKQL